jgi:hypothetical protein
MEIGSMTQGRGPKFAAIRRPIDGQLRRNIGMRRSVHRWWLYLVSAAVGVAYLTGPLKSGPEFQESR